MAALPTPLYAARGAGVGGTFHVTGGYYGGAYTTQVRLHFKSPVWNSLFLLSC